LRIHGGDPPKELQLWRHVVYQWREDERSYGIYGLDGKSGRESNDSQNFNWKFIPKYIITKPTYRKKVPFPPE
jgi:hypothetical protein